MLRVSQICLAGAIQASLSFYTSLWFLERFLILWHKMSQTHLDFPCLLVLACRQWGFCWECLGLCSTDLILVMRSPHRNSRFGVNVAGPALVVLRIVRHISATTIRELWNAKLYHSRCITARGYRTHLGWHSEVRETESSWESLDLGFCLFGVEGRMSKILMVHSFFGKFKI